MSDDLRNTTIKWFAVSAVFLVGAIFLYFGMDEQPGDFELRMSKIFLFAGVMCLAVGIVFSLFLKRESARRSYSDNRAPGILTILGAIAAIITIITALKNC